MKLKTKYVFFISLSLVLGCTQPIDSRSNSVENKTVVTEIKNDEDLDEFINNNFSLGQSYSAVSQRFENYGFKRYEIATPIANVEQYDYVLEVRQSAVLLVKIVISTEFENKKLETISDSTGLIGL